MANAPTLQIPQDVIQPIIDAHITAEIARAIGSGTIVQSAVDKILRTRVDGNGAIDTYNRGDSKPWIEWAVGDALKKRVQAIIIDAIATRTDVIEKQIVAELSKRNSPLIKQIAEGVAKVALSPDRMKYNISVTAECR